LAGKERFVSKVSSYIDRTWSLVRDRPKGWQSLLYNTAMAKARIAGPLMMPVHLTIEPTNACNARCPVCETGNGTMARRRGLIDFDVFRRFIDDVAPTTAVLMYYFMGEPFLHRRSYEMIRYARDKGIYVETCTNGDFVDAEGVVYSDINQINFQIGGMRQATHGIYRVRSDLDKIHLNLHALLDLRRRHPESNVEINVGFIVMKHNEHEVPEFLRWAKEIGVDRANVIDPCVRSIAEGDELLPADRRYWFYDEAAFARGVLKPKVVPDNECTWIWNSVTVNWDGSAVPCCRDPNGKHVFGNAFERPLREIWNDRPIRAFREQIVRAQGDIDICKLCSGYGVPKLDNPPPLQFEIKRLSLDAAALDIPADLGGDAAAEAAATARREHVA
jgi:radical SAM protein with 4Fe4S-binding SPASM domain